MKSNVRLASIADVARTGVDLVSVGELTRSVRGADLSMKIKRLTN